ncbi:hypothetical protein BaRGS_00030817 [Batillaria attramentaria]|uniref:LIM zinc-binding domain-containing protein n=1 Tax=Batillaria attramentaria TaxID=370345 RepID=A0ABD0JS47_9CAEN
MRLSAKGAPEDIQCRVTVSDSTAKSTFSASGSRPSSCTSSSLQSTLSVSTPAPVTATEGTWPASAIILPASVTTGEKASTQEVLSPSSGATAEELSPKEQRSPKGRKSLSPSLLRRALSPSLRRRGKYNVNKRSLSTGGSCHDTCQACGFPLTQEMVSVQGLHFHRACFRCNICDSPLTLQNHRKSMADSAGTVETSVEELGGEAVYGLWHWLAERGTQWTPGLRSPEAV